MKRSLAGIVDPFQTYWTQRLGPPRLLSWLHGGLLARLCDRRVTHQFCQPHLIHDVMTVGHYKDI
jgi:hypothetical protein